MLTYLIRTNSLNSDERFVKTLRFLDECHQETRVFGVVKTPTERDHGFIQKQLRFREWLPSGHLVSLKYVELVAATFWFIIRYRGRRWFANFDFLPVQVFSTLFAGAKSRPIWDLHEMPPPFVTRNWLLRRVFAFLLRRSHVIVCNDARRRALEEAFGVGLSSALILRNYPGREAREQLVAARQKHLSATERDKDALSVVIVGGNVPGRYVAESVEAIAELRKETGHDIRVTLVGGAPLEPAPDFVASTGFIPFCRLITECVKGGISLCFYRMNTLNNTLCEPNRFYQGLLAGQFVLTFDHPSLNGIRSPQRRIVDEVDFQASLKIALEELIADLLGVDQPAPSSLEDITDVFVFENQLPRFAEWFPRPH